MSYNRIVISPYRPHSLRPVLHASVQHAALSLIVLKNKLSFKIECASVDAAGIVVSFAIVAIVTTNDRLSKKGRGGILFAPSERRRKGILTKERRYRFPRRVSRRGTGARQSRGATTPTPPPLPPPPPPLSQIQTPRPPLPPLPPSRKRGETCGNTKRPPRRGGSWKDSGAPVGDAGLVVQVGDAGLVMPV